MERKDLELSVKEVADTGEFIGHASVFGNVDLGGDVITKGAFRKSINDNSGRFPLLDGHSETAGALIAEEDGYGLKVKGKINLDTALGRDLHSNMKFLKANGIDPGMSIGFLPVPGKVAHKEGYRELSEVKLVEVTVTPIPMNQLARVTAVKSADADAIAELRQRLTALEQKATEPAPAAPAKPEPVADHSAELAAATLRLALLN
jgi:HK97 family phage prohead protease